MFLKNTLVDLVLGFDPRKLWIRYIAAIGILALLVVGGLVVQQDMFGNAIRNGEALVELKRLRSASLRIVYSADYFAGTGTDTSRERLANEVAAFEVGLEAATRRIGELGAGDAPLRDRLDRLDERGAELLDFAERILSGDQAQSTRTAIRALVTGPLEGSFNGVIERFKAMSSERNDTAKLGSMLLHLAAIAVLLVQGVLIFWPAQVTVTRALDRLETSNHSLRVQSDQIAEYAEQLSESAFLDPLTGLINRRRLGEALKELLDRGDLDVRRVCVMHLDLDRFKEVNDTLGHAVGDAVLMHVAKTMVAKIRPGDLAARIGGDEFVIVMEFRPPDAEERAQRFCENLIKVLSTPTRFDGVETQVGASIGYTFATPADRDPDILIGNADIALYESKRGGKGMAQPFTATMRAGADLRFALIQDLERAIDQGEFVPYFQPQVSVATGKLAGFEMYARWNHPERGQLGPEDFLETANEVGLTDAIDSRMVIDGLDLLSGLRRQGWATQWLAINSAPRSPRISDYAERLEEAVRARGLAPEDIVVELLETTLISQSDVLVADSVESLSSAGFSVFVDNFGTGYASLANLATLNVSGLKIDRSLVAGIDSERTGKVVGAMVGLGRAMDLYVVAEGVENPAQFAALRALEVDAVQGYSIASPMDRDELRTWLARYGQGPVVKAV